MKRLFLILFVIAGFAPLRAEDADIAAVSKTLDAFHGAAAEADWDTYFGLMTDDSIFLGTDAAERWDKPTFMAYAKPTKGWKYNSLERHINITPDGGSAWFDEILWNEKYGTSRGSGVLIRENGAWKIAQYNLTFPIPNDLADGITQQIQIFEQRQKLGQN